MKFAKVSKEQFSYDVQNLYISPQDNDIEQIYYDIKIPCRATAGSAGYDFYLPGDLVLYPGNVALIPTGIKVELDSDKVLEIYPRSSLGFKYRMKICNTVGIIDADYYNNVNNEGHIMIKVENCGNSTIELAAGSAFAQGIIKQYFTVNNDVPVAEMRTGGMGSTDAK